MKTCRACKRQMDEGEFYVRDPKTRALHTNCKRCFLDKKASSVIAWRSANRAHIRRLARARYALDPEKHREKSRPHVRNYHANIRGLPGHISGEEWATQLEVFGHACAYCLRTDCQLVREHMAGANRGGTNTIDNVVPACRSCNSIKRDRGILYMVTADAGVI